MTKLTSFFVLALAKLQGDNNTTTAVKIWEKGKSGFETELAALKGKRVDLDQNLEDARAAVDSALVNDGQLIGDSNSRTQYVKNYLKAVNHVTDCEEAIEKHEATVKALEAALERLKTSSLKDLEKEIAK